MVIDVLLKYHDICFKRYTQHRYKSYVIFFKKKDVNNKLEQKQHERKKCSIICGCRITMAVPLAAVSGNTQSR